LPTDWGAPATGTLRRLSDHRVRQFWDSGHVLAKIVADTHDPRARAEFFDRHGTLWDLIAVYPAGAVWGGALPAATTFDGPVVRAMASRKIL
jgi:hypothetical protein